MKSFAFDIDGVITSNPDFYRHLTYLLHKNGHIIDIVTSRNPSRAKETEEELKRLGITYTDIHFMSSLLPRDYKTQGQWKLDTIATLKTDVWFDNEFKVYEKVLGLDFSGCRAERISV